MVELHSWCLLWKLICGKFHMSLQNSLSCLSNIQMKIWCIEFNHVAVGSKGLCNWAKSADDDPNRSQWLTSFATTKVEYLGMIIKPGQPAMDPVKLDGIASWLTPKTVKDIRSILSFANFEHHFIPDYSNVAWPLINLTKKSLPWNWSPTCQTSFKILKILFLSKPVHHLLDLAAPFTITTNASRIAPPVLSSSKLTQTANGTPAPTFPSYFPQQNETMISMTENSWLSSAPWSPGNITFTDLCSPFRSLPITKPYLFPLPTSSQLSTSLMAYWPHQ